MRQAFVALVVIHLLYDLASPSGGAFRFNPYESVDGVSVEVEEGQSAERALQTAALPDAAGRSTRSLRLAPAPRRQQVTPRLATILPRRNASPPDPASPPADDD